MYIYSPGQVPLARREHLISVLTEAKVKHHDCLHVNDGFCVQNNEFCIDKDEFCVKDLLGLDSAVCIHINMTILY